MLINLERILHIDSAYDTSIMLLLEPEKDTRQKQKLQYNPYERKHKSV